MQAITKLLTVLNDHQRNARSSLHFVPSESMLSPLARLPFILDAYSRYFFNYQRSSGKWSFHGGRGIGDIEREILIPALSEMTGAKLVEVRPISGMNCLTIVLAALANPGDIVLSVPEAMGGHMSTPVVAGRLGIKLSPLPMISPHSVDLDRLQDLLKRHQPALIYFDQSSLLFPLDPKPVRELVDQYSPHTLIHFDSSHLNGLILGKAIWNPLIRGADSFGGSTHKTLPGPHKAFVVTNNPDLFARIETKADHFVSHSHPAEIVSLAITILEMKECGGDTYARAVMSNAKTFATALHESGVQVAAADYGFTGCHQVWVTPNLPENPWSLGDRLYRCGLLVNNFEGLPGISQHCLRLSLAEPSKLGMLPAEMKGLAQLFIQGLNFDVPEHDVRAQVLKLRTEHPEPRYCFSLADMNRLDNFSFLHEFFTLMAH